MKHRNNWIISPWDFKTAVDEAGARNYQEKFPEDSLENSQGTLNSREISNSQETLYCFNDKEVFQALPFERDVKILISGEYVCLEAESNERIFRAVRPFAFRVLSLNESVLQKKLFSRFGTEGSEASPLIADYTEIETFLQLLGTQEAVLDPKKNISLKKELIYVRDSEEVSAFGCILIYQ